MARKSPGRKYSTYYFIFLLVVTISYINLVRYKRLFFYLHITPGTNVLLRLGFLSRSALRDHGYVHQLHEKSANFFSLHKDVTFKITHILSHLSLSLEMWCVYGRVVYEKLSNHRSSYSLAASFRASSSLVPQSGYAPCVYVGLAIDIILAWISQEETSLLAQCPVYTQTQNHRMSMYGANAKTESRKEISHLRVTLIFLLQA